MGVFEGEPRVAVSVVAAALDPDQAIQLRVGGTTDPTGRTYPVLYQSILVPDSTGSLRFGVGSPVEIPIPPATARVCVTAARTQASAALIDLPLLCTGALEAATTVVEE